MLIIVYGSQSQSPMVLVDLLWCLPHYVSWIMRLGILTRQVQERNSTLETTNPYYLTWKTNVGSISAFSGLEQLGSPGIFLGVTNEETLPHSSHPNVINNLPHSSHPKSIARVMFSSTMGGLLLFYFSWHINNVKLVCKTVNKTLDKNFSTKETNSSFCLSLLSF